MAGIGFELKKIFEEKKISSMIKGFSYATMISVGPMLISVLMLISISIILQIINIDISNRVVITVSIMYAFIFAMISVSGFVMVISRYISDKLYIGDINDILSSMVGVIAINLLLGGGIAGVFYYFSPLEFTFKILSYLFFIELSVIYILIAYISALKDYMRIVIAFALGAFPAILFSLIFIVLHMEIASAILLGMVFGFLITTILMLIAIKKFFNIMNDNIFGFVHYIYKMPYLFLINLFYTFGLFAHNFVFWEYSDISSTIKGTFLLSYVYDNATFFAVLTIIPAVVLFIVRIETAFYTKYRKFCKSLDGGGSLRDIEIAKREMTGVLRRELSNIIQVQFVLTLLASVIGITVLLPLLGRDRQTMEIFVLLSIGYFMTYMTFIIMTILLYFDNQEDSLKISIVFLVGNISFTYITVLLGQEYYGLGLPISSMISLVIANLYLNKTLNNIDYRIFSKETRFINIKAYNNTSPKESDNSE